MKKRLTAQSAFFSLRASIALVVCVAAASPVLIAPLLAFLRPEVPSKSSQRTLTFADRVTYQHAIEEVYWRHRIWPKENALPKPRLDKVMSQAQLEKKVTDYLRDSQALEDYWQRPLTAEQLQAEMDRMVNNTKQPDVLRELFEALGNDPFVIAECLARPVLAERLATELYAHDQRFHGDLKRRAKAEAQVPVTMASVSANYALPVIVTHFPDPCTVPWTPTSTTNAPTARFHHTAVWTGSEMIVWGGWNGSEVFNTGGRYNPSTDSWTATSTTDAPAARQNHTAVWTGSEMIVWGGYNGSSNFNNGGRYNPSTDNWTATITTNAPDARQNHTAVWTGNEMIVWGGGGSSDYLNSGGRYNPGMNSWTATSTVNAPAAREFHTAVWTGSEMIVWGGQDNFNNYLNTGGRYNPATNSWTTTATTNAPAGRYYHTAVWTGSQMIVWGGYVGGQSFLNAGGRYDPSTDSWGATNTTDAPAARCLHAAVWTGSEMIVWGGVNDSICFNTGGRYDPAADTWAAITTNNAPAARDVHVGVWTGSEMIVWGGVSNGSLLNTGSRYCAAAPGVQVLYDQYNNTGTSGTVSATFTDSPSHNSDLADDFVVPGGQTWNVQLIDAQGTYFNGSGPANSFNVFFYTNSGGFPGTRVYSATNLPFTQSGTTFTVNPPTPAVLNAGRYWVEIQANMTFNGSGEWGWADRTATSNFTAVWRNPGGGFGLCPSWSRRGATCNIDPSEPDQVYRLSGTIGGPLPTPTPTLTPTPTPTPTPSPTASPTPTPTPTPCTGRCSPTPRPRPTASPRPTPPTRLTPPPTPTGSPRPTPAPRP